MSRNQHVNPFGALVKCQFWAYSKFSLRSLLFGLNPELTPQFIVAHEGRWINRDTLVDLYAIGWPLIAACSLWRVNSFGPLEESVVGLAITYRLWELCGGVFYVLVMRARFDYPDGRKMIISLLAYLEPILLFAVLHGVVALMLARCYGLGAGAGYSLGDRAWTWTTILHYSVGCYTTVGWGDISSNHSVTMLVSDAETVTGILMLTFTISRFVSAALDVTLRKQVEDIEEKTKSAGS
jgi:Ion channel